MWVQLTNYTCESAVIVSAEIFLDLLALRIFSVRSVEQEVQRFRGAWVNLSLNKAVPGSESRPLLFMLLTMSYLARGQVNFPEDQHSVWKRGLLEHKSTSLRRYKKGCISSEFIRSTFLSRTFFECFSHHCHPCRFPRTALGNW